MFGRKKNKQDIDISAPHDGSFRRGVHIEEIDGSGELVVRFFSFSLKLFFT